jgi:hypothetical protein
VVRSVLKVLHSCQSGSIVLPDFDDLTPDERIKAKSLVDIHVLKVGAEMKLQEGHLYAVSVTPAITIVLAALLRSATSLQSTWSGLESVVALIELFKLVREAQGDTVPAFQIVQLDRAYPAKAGVKLLEVPEMTNSIVFINGARAPYADVIAPFRLIQAKHCDSGNIATVKIVEELQKLGVLTTSSLQQKVFVAEQYRMWQSMDTASANPSPEGDQPTATARQHDDNASRRHYPGTLLASQKAQKKSACRTYKLHKEQWLQTNAGATKAVDPNMNIDPLRPLTVVFVTNASIFQLKHTLGKEKVPNYQDFSEELVLLPASEDSNLSDIAFNDVRSTLVQGVVVKLAFTKS